MMDATWLHRYRLIGDEDCGVGIECRDHFDGGRPLAYYDAGDGKLYGGRPLAYYDAGDGKLYKDDPAVTDVSTIPGLLAAALVHEQEMHGNAVASAVSIYAQGGVVSGQQLAEMIRRHAGRGGSWTAR